MKSNGSDVLRPRDKRISKNFASSLLARLARAMENSEVPYLLTGADAVSYYGAPRRSDDKDLVVMTNSPDDLPKVVEELRKEGFELKSLEIGHNTFFDSGFRIDIKVKSELEERRRVRLTGSLSLNLTTAENLILVKLEFWDGLSFESNDAQDLMKILSRQRKRLDMVQIRSEAMKRRTYRKLAKIEQHLSNSFTG